MGTASRRPRAWDRHPSAAPDSRSEIYPAPRPRVRVNSSPGGLRSSQTLNGMSRRCCFVTLVSVIKILYPSAANTVGSWTLREMDSFLMALSTSTGFTNPQIVNRPNLMQRSLTTYSPESNFRPAETTLRYRCGLATGQRHGRHARCLRFLHHTSVGRAPHSSLIPNWRKWRFDIAGLPYQRARTGMGQRASG